MKILFSAALLLASILAANAGQAVITTGPASLTINAGSTALFTVSAANATNYQWTFKGAGMSKAANIAGATNSQYKIDDTATNQAGVYSVIVAGSSGTNAASSATLTVLQGTIINFQISGFSSGPSNVLVELFDHDKPATVQNFIHYVNTIAYKNMFFDRLIPGFVLQGGSWYTQDKTNPAPPPTVGNIFETYGSSFYINNPSLPGHIDSEFYLGPQVSNIKGTIAMALPPGDADGAQDAFFFNLVDNTNLDSTITGGGPFTVFGRVLSGSNVLDYFNNTNKFFKPPYIAGDTNNIFTNGIFDQDYINSNYTSFTDLPVNYHGTNVPADSNLFFVDFTFPVANAQPFIDTNPPSAVITFPPPDGIVPNGASLTVQGTAQAVMGDTALSLDGKMLNVPASAQGDAGLAVIYCTVTGGGNFVPEVVTGTTNWSLDAGVLPLGSYNILITPQDGAGNEGNLVKEQVIVSAVGVSGVGSVSATNPATGDFISDAVGASLQDGANYLLVPNPNPGQSFINWTVGTNVLTNQTLTVQMSSNLFVTANFTGRVSFSYPPPGGSASNGNFSIYGPIYGLANLPLAINCQLFSFTNQQLPVSQLFQTNATTAWSFQFTNLPLGHYFVRVTATDTAGQTTFITNDFTAGLPVTILSKGNGRGAITASFTSQQLVAGQTYYAAEGQTCSLKAVAASGSVFDSWFNGSSYSDNPSFSFVMAPGLASPAVTFVSNDFPGAVSSPIQFTYPAASAKIPAQTFNLTGTLNPALTNPVVSYQLFFASNSIAPPSTNVTITPAPSKTARPAWSVGLTNLVPGSYTVVATVTDILGRTALISENFQVLARLTLQISPPGYGTLSSNWNAPFVPIGASCTVTAKTNGGGVFLSWSNSASSSVSEANPLTFTVTTNSTITANFVSNYFPGGAGAYNGLFFPTNSATPVSPANSGYYSIQIASSGMISLKLGFPAFTNTASGALELYNPSLPAGMTGFQVVWGGDLMTNDVTVNLTNGTLGGVVAGPGFFSPLTAYRAAAKLTSNSAVVPGTDVLSIHGDHIGTNNLPGGDSYATFTISSNAMISLIGWLGDNSSFSQGAQISLNSNLYVNELVTNAAWPFYASLDGGKGVILGWLTNYSPSNFTGTVAWSKQAGAGSYYTNGILLITNAYTAPYIPPVKNSAYQIVFGGASLPNDLTNRLIYGANGIFTNQSGGQAANLLLTLSTNSGVLIGSFTHPSGKATNYFHGAFTSPALGGSGYFLDTNSQTGFFQITRLAP